MAGPTVGPFALFNTRCLLFFFLFFFFFFFFLSFFTSHNIFSSFFPLLVLSKLYSVICCGVGGVNGWICYGGLVWCFVVCTMMVFFNWVLGSVNGWRGRQWTVLESNLGSMSLGIGGWRKKKESKSCTMSICESHKK